MVHGRGKKGGADRLFRGKGMYDHPSGRLCDLGEYPETGSYEPDQYNEGEGVNLTSFDPQALTSLTLPEPFDLDPFYMFRSTGSYEPDPRQAGNGKVLVTTLSFR